MRMQQEDGGNEALAWPSRRYERQEKALIAELANGERLPAEYKGLKDGISAFKSTGVEEREGMQCQRRIERGNEGGRCRGGTALSHRTTNCYLSNPIQRPGSAIFSPTTKNKLFCRKSSNHHTQPSPSIFFSLSCSIFHHSFLFLSSPPHHAPLCPALVK
jgi:hypothetical protein